MEQKQVTGLSRRDDDDVDFSLVNGCPVITRMRVRYHINVEAGDIAYES